jgi:Cyclic nucleotide-binding domain
MRFESAATTVSWIPSAAITGPTKAPFELGFTHYDDPPPDLLVDLDRVVGPEGARFANELRGWITVEAGRVVGYGQLGHGWISNTRIQLAGMVVFVQAVPFPDLRPEPEVGDGFVRFRQTAGGRPGMNPPRLVGEPPFFKIQGPTVWTTLALTIYADGTSTRELVGASTFPRHWLYDENGVLAGKSAVIDFKEWYHHAYGSHSPWGDEEHPVPMTAAETSLERRLSAVIMRHGETTPKPSKVRAGKRLFVEGEVGDDLALVLDGVVDVDVGGTSVAELGPGSVLGERAGEGSGRRTATVTALTDCRVVRVRRELLDDGDLRELSAGHRREERG